MTFAFFIPHSARDADAIMALFFLNLDNPER